MRGNIAALCVVSAAAIWSACSPNGELNARQWGNPGRAQGPDGGADGGGRAEPPPGGELPDEQFPPELLEPYTGPPVDYYDNTGLGYRQLRARVDRVFADPGIGGDTNAYFAAKITLLGGADFTSTYNEARVITQDFLLALDAIAKDACARAATNKTGPFAGIDAANIAAPAKQSTATQLFERVLFRAPTADETTASVALVDEIGGGISGWSALCEALVRHPDAIFTLPPSASTTNGIEKERLQIVKLSMDLAGRPPSDAELTSLLGKTVEEKVDAFVALPEFRDFFFHRARVRLESIGTPESDEAARLWTHLATTGAPMQELLTANYTIDPSFQVASRPAYHGKTGVLTMPGFIKPKPGLPHYNYAARVMTDFMGQLFELTPELVASRTANATAESTVAPGTVCYSCHSILTPLATQRSRWADDGTYREVDANGLPIDDSDRNLVPAYPYKGQGMEAFAVQAVRKEKFFRQTFQALFLLFLGRQMRYAEDERTVYLDLWRTAFATKGDLRALIKVVAKLPGYLGEGK